MLKDRGYPRLKVRMAKEQGMTKLTEAEVAMAKAVEANAIAEAKESIDG